MSQRGTTIGASLLTLLSVVVIFQAAVLAWVLLISPNRIQTLEDLRRRPVETVVEMCLPASSGPSAGQTAFPDR
ncbi:MAG: hypothetical protein V4707_10025 [Pseudomonadota bacterium]